MSDASAPPTPVPSEAAPANEASLDPLAGDWSQGLPGPLRAHGIPLPSLIALNSGQGMPEVVFDVEEVLRTPLTDDGVQSPASPAGGFVDHVAAASPTPAFVPDAAPPGMMPSAPAGPPPFADVAGTPAPGELPPEDSAPTPWSEAATSRETALGIEPPGGGWDTPAPTAEPVQEWQAEAPVADFQEVRQPEAGVPAAESDWSSLRTGPDWAAGSAHSGGESWGAAPPAAAESQWTAAPPTAAESDWSPAPAAASLTAAPAPAWNAPAVGASALEQLESEPPEPEPGAAKELFGMVPTGGMLAGDDDLGSPQDLASPEEVLRPVAIDHEDPDLPAAVNEPERPTRSRAQPLAAFRPAALGALEVHGEHRVAVHTRGGRTLRGTMRDVDLSKSQFPLVPQGGGEPEAIYHAEVKAIFFMLPAGEKAHSGDGANVRVTFADGRIIEGVRDGPDAKHGFFLVPLDAARTNTRRIYVAREATSEIKDA
jgi:uncharacterized protein DUF6982